MSSWIILGAALAALAAAYAAWRAFRKPDAYIYVPEGVAMAEWQYKQLPMHECKFCGSKVNLNRHHVISQLACPERKNDPQNLIVLCRSCHQVVGHKNNWKKFNPYVAEICEKYGGPPVDSKEWRHQHEDKTQSNSNNDLDVDVQRNINVLLDTTANAESVGDLEQAFAEMFHLPYWDDDLDDYEWCDGYHDLLYAFVRQWREKYGMLPAELRRWRRKHESKEKQA